MESVLYIKISQNSHPIKKCPVNALATCWELLFASLTSLICASYALHHEQQITNSPPSPSSQIFFSDTGVFSFILDPPPALMLSSCIALGCSISSFAYRRQEEDRFQPLIFVAGIIAATVLGLSVEMDASLVMLALIPAALVAAMITSTSVHWALRRLRTSSLNIRIRCVERGEQLPAAQPLLSEKEPTSTT